MGHDLSTMKILRFRKWTKDRDRWLQTIIRGQVLTELTKLYCDGNLDNDPVLKPAEVEHFRANPNERRDLIKGYVTSCYRSEPHGDFTLAEDVNVMLDRILAYHAAYPFTFDVPFDLDEDAYLRAVTLLSGAGQKAIGSGRKQNGKVLTPQWSEIDYRRLLFCSLAVPIRVLSDPWLLTVRETCDKEEPMQAILDVLATLQPRMSSSTPALSRQQLEPTAHRICKGVTKLDSLCIPRQHMLTLLTLLVACRFVGLASVEENLDTYMNNFILAAHRLLRSFRCASDGVVGWEIFNKVIERIMPWLCTGLQQLMLLAYAPQDRNPIPIRAISDRNRIYDALLPQLLTFLPKYVHQKLCQPTSVFTSCAPYHSLDGLVDRLQGKPGPLIFLIATSPREGWGSIRPPVPSWEKGPIFGAFIPTSFFLDQGDIPHSKTARLLHRSLLFKLGPSQDVFPVRHNIEGLPWHAFHYAKAGPDGGVSFGRPVAFHRQPCSGVSLRIDNYGGGIFECNADEEGVYRPSAAFPEPKYDRGDKFEVRGLELLAL
ncbi:MAG: hypothetical protein Q9213_005447 [Squamulea squamosa]